MRILSLACLLLLAAPLAASSASPATPPELTFEAGAVLARGVTPKGRLVWFSVAREISRQSATIVPRIEQKADEDGDGVVRLELGQDVPLRSMAVDALGGIALKEASHALRLGWTSRANLLKHFGQHGKEFGFKLAEQYGAAARRLAGSVGEEGVESVVTKTGERLIFNTSTTEFAVVNKHGRIVTYFKASYKYWLSKVRQAGGAVK